MSSLLFQEAITVLQYGLHVIWLSKILNYDNLHVFSTFSRFNNIIPNINDEAEFWRLKV